jgi:hypothetical protein
VLKDYKFDPWTSRLSEHYRYIRDGQIIEGGTLNARMYSLHEIAATCQVAGLRPTGARHIRTGTVTINGSPISFDGPSGGYKASGTGREYGAVGLGEYLEHKTVTRKRQA